MLLHLNPEYQRITLRIHQAYGFLCCLPVLPRDLHENSTCIAAPTAVACFSAIGQQPMLQDNTAGLLGCPLVPTQGGAHSCCSPTLSKQPVLMPPRRWLAMWLTMGQASSPEVVLAVEAAPPRGWAHLWYSLIVGAAWRLPVMSLLG